MMWVAVEIARLSLIVIAAGITLGLLFTVLHIGWDRWKEARELSGSFLGAMQGEVETDRNGLRDPRVTKGKVWDKATERWHNQGKLSDEYVKNLIG